MPAQHQWLFGQMMPEKIVDIPYQPMIKKNCSITLSRPKNKYYFILAAMAFLDL
jgi:hypothetical protein